MIFRIASGINDFHPSRMSWSKRNRGNVQRTHIKIKPKKVIFTKRMKKPRMASEFGESPSLSTKGKLYPPKNTVAMMAPEMNMLIYSAKR